MSNLTKANEKTLTNLLRRLKPGFLPYDVFVELARLVVFSIIEYVPLRINEKGEVEVLLLPRAEDDPIWPGEFHTPGTVIRPTDNEGQMYLAFDRILNDELKNTKVSKPYFVGNILHKSKRGTEQAQVYWVEVIGRPEVGEFYPVSNLPKRLIESQRKFIIQAAASFSKAKTL